MNSTLVIQSHRQPLPFEWLQSCLESVRAWSSDNQYEYRFLGDELFAGIDAELIEKTRGQVVIATDLGRLQVLQQALQEGYETVVWLDADFLVFKPEAFVLPKTKYAVGREVWVQTDQNNKLKVYKKVHNAFLMFRAGNPFLGFYLETAEKLLRNNTGSMPPQFIGPKLLTALHNIAGLPVMETAGMLSPAVVRDLLAGQGAAVDLFKQYSEETLAGANLCSSSSDKNEVSDSEIVALIQKLKNTGIVPGRVEI